MKFYPGAPTTSYSINRLNYLLTSIFIVVIWGCNLPSSVVTNNNQNNTVTNNTNATNPIDNKNSNKSDYIVYDTHPNASVLLSKKDLDNHKVYTSLTEALQEPEKVYRLNLSDYDSNFDLLNLSPEIGKLFNVQELIIDGVYESLPKEIGKLTQIQYATFRLPNIKKEPPLEIANWKNIKSLTIDVSTGASSTESSIKWTSLNHLISLNELRLENRGIKNLPKDMFRFVHLQKLELINTEIYDLSELANLSNLKILNLLDNSKLIYFPDGGNLTSLSSIELTNLPQLKTFLKRIGANSISSMRIINCPKLVIEESFFEYFKINGDITTSKSPGINVPNKYKITINTDGFYAKVTADVSFDENQDAFFKYYNQKTSFSISSDYADKTIKKEYVRGIIFISNNETDKKVFKELYLYPNVEIINIEFNNGIDYDGPVLKNVKKISIFGSNASDSKKFTNFNKLIAACPNLEELEINAGCTEFPNAVYNSVNLTKLMVLIWEPGVNFRFELKDEIKNLSKLKSLSITINDIQAPINGKISKEINQLTNLENLEIQLSLGNLKTPSFTYPDGIENLKNLKRIKLSTVTSSPTGLEKLNLEFKEIKIR